jgi:glycerol-3-phosphate dehydrogenase
MRLAFLDQQASLAAVDRVTELLAAELGWDEARAASDRADTLAYLV